jgi:hypothetical protein
MVADSIPVSRSNSRIYEENPRLTPGILYVNRRVHMLSRQGVGEDIGAVE